MHVVRNPQSALETLPTAPPVVILSNVRATELVRDRMVFSDTAFAELVLWLVPQPVGGSNHNYKYRLAYVVDAVCVLRYDNERGKGDHRHFGDRVSAYAFSSPDQLISDFQRDIARWNHENRHS